ncbi:hypothetical protein MC885_011947 [Smutsia gigantea]|nr:hypothetical protein MC885_011947 [Smutsia gigantea]
MPRSAGSRAGRARTPPSTYKETASQSPKSSTDTGASSPEGRVKESSEWAVAKAAFKGGL